MTSTTLKLISYLFRKYKMEVNGDYFKSKDSELFQTVLHFGSTIGHSERLEVLGIICWQAKVSQV